MARFESRMKAVFSRVLAGLVAAAPFVQSQTPGPAPLTLSLGDAVRLALSAQGNMAIDIQAESIKAAEARRRQARAAFLPDIETSITDQEQALNLDALGLGNVQTPLAGFNFPRSSGAFNTLDARVHVRQDLLDTASRRHTQAAGASVESARTESGEVRDQVTAKVAKVYLAALRADTMIERAEALLATSDSTLIEFSNRREAGEALGPDVARARVNRASAEQRLKEARFERQRSRLQLLTALNRDLDTPLHLTGSLTLTGVENTSPADAVAVALKSRSDMLAQGRRIEAARLNAAAIHSERLPSLTGYANVGTMGTTIRDSIVTYDAGLSLRIPVFDGHRRDSRSAETDALLRQEQLRLSQLEKQVQYEVRQAVLKVELARGQVEIAADEVEIAAEDLAHIQRRRGQGVAATTQSTAAQVNLIEAQDRRAAALYAWNEARIELMEAMGTIHTLAE